MQNKKKRRSGTENTVIKKSARKRNSRKERAGVEKRQVQYEYM